MLRYGTGLLANLIRVFNPFAKDKHSALVSAATDQCEVLRDRKADEGKESVPYPIYPQKGGLLPWGNDENGNYYYWQTRGAPNKWNVVVEVRGGEWEEFDCSLTTFLAKFLRKELRCDIASKWPAKKDWVFAPFESEPADAEEMAPQRPPGPEPEVMLKAPAKVRPIREWLSLSMSDDRVESIALSRSRAFLAFAHGVTLYLWDLETNKLIAEMKDEMAISALAFSPDSKLLASSLQGEQGTIRF